MDLSERRLLAREATISAALAATLAALLLWSLPPGADWAAHAYQRTFLLQHGFAIWNNFWYAGRYSFITYSLLYYPLAALFGIRILALASIATGAFAFSIVVFRQWGPSSRLSSRSFAVLWVGIVGAAAFPFALGISFALLSIWALQRGRRGRFAVGAALTLAASPLSFAFLVFVLAGIVLARRRVRDVGAPIAAVGACTAAELVLYRLFGGGGRFPYGAWQLLPSLIFGVLGLVVTRDVPAAKSLRGLFWIYLAVCVFAYLVPTSVGSNLERLRYLALPLALMIGALRGWRPLWLLVPTVALAATWNITPIWSSFARASTDPEASRAYWQPTIAYLERHLTAAYRVEVVDTAEHWSAAYFPDAGIPIVRGWYRQSDFPQNELLYDAQLGARTYDNWLRQMAVRYVVLADAPVDYSARKEAELVRSGRSGLVLVKRFAHQSVYALPKATPLVTGPAHPAVVGFQPQQLVVALPARGTYRVRVRWSPFWRTSSGCVSRRPDGMTQLTVSDPGFVDLSFGVNVKRSLETLAGQTPEAQCAAGSRAQR
jgi:hypothetical protein